jgi:glycosyltransferase involved in cell wall biosynthesis
MKNNNKIRILQTIRQGQIGGGESHVLDLVTNMNREEFEPVVLSFTDGPMVERLNKLKIATYVVQTLKPFNLATFNNVQAIMRSENIDILHAHGTRALSNTIFPAKALGLPVIYTVHGWSFHQDQLFPVKKVRELSEKFLTGNADLTISVSNSNQQDGISRFNMQRSKVVNYGVDLMRYNPNRPLKDISSELGIEPGKTTVGFIVRMTAQKDPFTMVRAVAYVKKLCKDLQFIFVGDGDLKQATMDLAEELDVMDMIRFHPFRQDIPEVLKAVDIYCLPSLWEGLPIGMLEAMAMRKTIVATPVDGTREAIRNDFNGVLVPCRDHEALALSLLRLHFNPELQTQFSERAYQTVRKSFDLRTMVTSNEEIYRSMMRKKMSA